MDIEYPEWKAETALVNAADLHDFPSEEWELGLSIWFPEEWKRLQYMKQPWYKRLWHWWRAKVLGAGGEEE